MIAPASLSDLIAADPVTPLCDAIRGKLDALLSGVKVKAHPGKLDIYDVVKRSVVGAPGIALGWTSIKAPRRISGDFCLPVDFAAYIAVEDKAISGKRVNRETLGHAIGTRLLAILHDPDTAAWGMENVSLPAGDPGPALKPIFTATAFEKGTAYYAVTWSQEIVGLGPDFLGGPTPVFVSHEDELGPGVKFAEEADIPPEIAALIAEDAESGS